jgi:hypothetical protein
VLLLEDIKFHQRVPPTVRYTADHSSRSDDRMMETLERSRLRMAEFEIPFIRIAELRAQYLKASFPVTSSGLPRAHISWLD